jgi:pilus assembly protein CpaE
MADRSGVQDEITILLVDDDESQATTLRTLLSIESGMRCLGIAPTGAEAIRMAKELTPDIVVMDINLPDMDGFEVTEQIMTSIPGCAVIIMSITQDTQYLRRALYVGAREYLTKPVNPDELYHAIRTVHKNRPVPPIGNTGPLDKPDPSVMERGKLVVVYGPQGGVGRTTIAINVAEGLMRDGARVLLVDADLQFGDVPVMLNLHPQITLANLLRTADDLDLEYFDNVVLRHAGGLHVLPGSRRLPEAMSARPDLSRLPGMLYQIGELYDYIVVDTSVTVDDTLIALMGQADRVVLVSTPMLESAKNVRMLLEMFAEIGFAPDKLSLVLNRVPVEDYGRTGAISTERIEQFLRLDTISELPNDASRLRSAVTRGVSLIAFDPSRRNALADGLARLGDRIYKLLNADDDTDVPAF